MKTSIVIFFGLILFLDVFSHPGILEPNQPANIFNGIVDRRSEVKVVFSEGFSNICYLGCGPIAVARNIDYFDTQGYSDLIIGKSYMYKNGVDNVINVDFEKDYLLPNLSIVPTSHDFGLIECTYYSDFTEFIITNTGEGTTEGTVHTTHPSFWIDDYYGLTFSLDPYESDTFSVKFQPNDPTQYSELLIVSCENGTNFTTVLTGEGYTMAPISEFSANNINPSVGDTVVFNDLSGSNPSEWFWSFIPSMVTFVNGTNSSSQEPNVIFNAYDSYKVMLEVTNCNGSDLEEKEDYIDTDGCQYSYYNPLDTLSHWILRVEFHTINNLSGDVGPVNYFDFTYLSTDVNRGEAYDLIVYASSELENDDWVYNCTVGIDWDQDCYFNSIDENYIFSYKLTDPLRYVVNIDVPIDAAIGRTRMSVHLEDYVLDTEDYSVIVRDGEFISIISPQGNDVLSKGQTYSIIWNSNISEYVNIQLGRLDSFFYTIADSIENDGLFDWLVPNEIINFFDYQIKISSTSNENLYDITDIDLRICDVCPPHISVTPEIFDFGNLGPGLEDSTNFEVINDGGQFVEIYIPIYKTSMFEVSSGFGTFDLAPGESHLFTIKFTPYDFTEYIQRFTINGTNPCNSTSIILKGFCGFNDLSCWVSPKDAGIVSPTDQYGWPGDQYCISAIPNPGYEFDFWKEPSKAIKSYGDEFCFIGEFHTDYDFTAYFKPISYLFDLKVFMEGPFNVLSGSMNTALNNKLPLSQPFSISPWNYFGEESIESLPTDDIVDWVLVEVRNTLGTVESATEFTRVDRKAAFLISDGNIVDLDGNSPIEMQGTFDKNIFVAIWHRNHLGIMNSTPIILTNGVFTYDYTSGVDKVVGLDKGQKEISEGKWGMMGGDGDASGIIDTIDNYTYWKSIAGESGYISEDFSLDGEVNNKDKNEIWYSNLGYSAQVPIDTFICGDTIIDLRDGQSYSTIQIGDQCWMSENLNIGTMMQYEESSYNNGIIEKYCYDNTPSYCDTYGGLYKWKEMLQYNECPGVQGVCPSGWHVSTDSEWIVMTNYLGGSTVAGGALKVTGYEHWLSPNTGATNESGFFSLPNGRLTPTGFLLQSYNAAYWTSTTASMQIDGWYWTQHYNHTKSKHYSHNETNYAHAVRCVKDQMGKTKPNRPTSPYPVNGLIGVPVNTTLSWECFDLDDDPLIFDVYLGTTINPPLLLSGHNDFEFQPELSSETNYYWKIVAKDEQGNTVSGPIWSFITEIFMWQCGDTINDIRDGMVYNTVEIGTQCWMAENLNVGIMVNSNLVSQYNNDTIEKYCYNNSIYYCNTYGGLYLWNELMKYESIEGLQGICPDGWHIPSDDEWCTLENEVDAGIILCSEIGFRGIDVGLNLKSYGGWYSDGDGINLYGFNALAAGFSYSNGLFGGIHTQGNFWSSTEGTTDISSWYRALYDEVDNIYRFKYAQDCGLSVRCLKD